MAILFGLLAAVFYGAADFCGGFATKRSDMYAVTATSQAAGLLLLLVLLPVLGGHFTEHALLYGAIGGIAGAAGVLLLYHALSIGKMGVVSPITAVLAAAVPVIAGFVHGEHLRIWQIAGIAIALVSVVLISLSTEPDGRFEFSTAGVREAIASGVLLGGYLLFLSLAGSDAGVYPLLFARVASVVVLVLCAAILHRKLVPARGSVGIVLLTGVIDMSANVLYVLAVYAGYLSIAAVLTSLYPGSTVLLARIILGERLGIVQKAGVALALAGVALIAS